MDKTVQKKKVAIKHKDLLKDRVTQTAELANCDMYPLDQRCLSVIEL